MAEPLTFVSLGIGAWGAVIATGLAVRQVRQDRRSLNVTCRIGYMPGTGRSTFEVISIFAANEGHRPIEVSGASFRLDDGSDLFAVPQIGKAKLPAMLGDGESVVIHFDKQALDEIQKDGRRVLLAIVWDASRTGYTTPYPTSE